MDKVTVGDGWVILRDPKQVSERNRRPIIAKATMMQRAAFRVQEGIQGDGLVPEDEFLALYEFNDLVAVALIQEWSWDMPITVDSLLDLPSTTYDEVLKVTAPLVTDLMPSFEPDVDDPNSPTGPSVE